MFLQFYLIISIVNIITEYKGEIVDKTKRLKVYPQRRIIDV